MGKTNCPLNSTRQAQNESKTHCTGHLNIFLPQNGITVKGVSPGVHKTVSLYSWKFLPNSARSHWLLRGHMTSNNKTRISMLLVWEIYYYIFRSGPVIKCLLLCGLFLTDRGFS